MSVMHTSLHSELAKARVDTFRAEATTTHITAQAVSDGRADAVVALRFAHEDEQPAISRLAALDSRRAPAGDVLLALVDGEPVAAVSLNDGAVVADPFAPTADAVALLRLRAEHLRNSGQAPRRRRRMLPRLAA
jgi:hypothetical protein